MDNASYQARLAAIKARLPVVADAHNASLFMATDRKASKAARAEGLGIHEACRREMRRLSTAWDVLVCQRHAYGLVR